MYKVTWLVKFQPDKDPDEVRRWWLESHGKLGAATPGMVRYVQNHWVSALDPVTEMPTSSIPMAYDGHADHWFETKESYEAAMASDHWKEVLADGPVGFDPTSLTGGLIKEYVINWDSGPSGQSYPTLGKQ